MRCIEMPLSFTLYLARTHAIVLLLPVSSQRYHYAKASVGDEEVMASVRLQGALS